MIWLNIIIQGALVGGFYALFACGLSLMFGVLKVINLAHGDMAVVAGYVAVFLTPRLHVPELWSFLVVVPLFALLGYVVQRTLIQKSIDRDPFTTLLVTFGLSVVIENLLLEIYSANGQSVNIGSLIGQSWHPASIIYVSYVSMVVLAAAVLVLLALQIFLSKSGMGRLIRAVADDQEAAQLSGANYRHIFGIAAAIAFATVALAGIAYGMMTQFAPTSGGVNLLFAFEVVVIGGIGSLWGTLVGGVGLGIAQQFGAHINPSYQILAGNVLFLVVLAVRPQGLFGRRSAMHSAVVTVVGASVLVVLLTIAPWIVPAEFATTLTNFFILVIMSTMWNLLAGYAGMVSIGQQAFVGLGAYATLYFALEGVNPFVAIPIAAAVCGLLAVPITYLLFRLRGGYFSIATWVVADTALLLIGTVAFLGGGTGRLVPGMQNLSPSQTAHFSYLATWVVALIVVTGTYFLLRSRTGLVLASIRDNEVAARSAGVNVRAARRMIFVVAAAGCGAAGAVLAISQPFVQPSAEFSLQWAAEMLFVSMIGGLGTIEGPIIGCIIYFALQQTLQQDGVWYLIIFGALAVAIALWKPRGLWGAFRDRFHSELLPVGHWVEPPESTS